MRALLVVSCLWPGLPRLWLRGDWLSLGAAVAFGAALNLVLVSSFVWPELLPTSLVILGWLSLEEGLSQAELAQRMEIEPPTLAGILERMERDGWVVREPCPEDRRRKLVRPGAKSRDAWHEVVVIARRVRERATRGIPKERLDELKVLLERIRTNLHPETDPEGDR